MHTNYHDSVWFTAMSQLVSDTIFWWPIRVLVLDKEVKSLSPNTATQCLTSSYSSKPSGRYRFSKIKLFTVPPIVLVYLVWKTITDTMTNTEWRIRCALRWILLAALRHAVSISNIDRSFDIGTMISHISCRYSSPFMFNKHSMLCS